MVFLVHLCAFLWGGRRFISDGVVNVQDAAVTIFGVADVVDHKAGHAPDDAGDDGITVKLDEHDRVDEDADRHTDFNERRLVRTVQFGVTLAQTERGSDTDDVVEKVSKQTD